MRIIEVIDSILPAFFEHIANPFWDSLMVFITKLGDGGFLWIAVILIMLFSKKYRKIGIVAALSLLICFVTGNYFFKPIVGRIRPCNVFTDLRMVVPPLSDFSFPSMHSATAFSVSGVINIYNKKIGISAIIISMLIALSRVYLNLHFTTDILFGMLYGFFIAYFVNFVIKKTNLNRLSY